MVSGTASLMPLVEELIHEFDQPAQASTMRIVQTGDSQAGRGRRIVEEQVGRRGGSGSSFYRSYGRWSPFGGGAAASSSGTDDLTVTPVEASGLVILRGPEKKVYEAEQLIRQLDAQARPDGPIIKVYELQYADVYDVVSTLEQMVSGATSGSGYGSMASYGGGRTRGGAAGDGQVVIQSDTYGKRIIVSAPYDKIPLIEKIIEENEKLAEPTEVAGVVGGGEVIEQTRDSITKSYKIEKGSADDIARALDRILIDRFGYWDSPYVKSFSYSNEVIVTGKPEHFKEVERWLETLEENPPAPRIMLMVKQVKGGNAGKVVQMVTQSATPELRQKLEVQEIPQLRGDVTRWI
jgi:type II secretory pathway component GspD/PulD (secretin)